MILRLFTMLQGWLNRPAARSIPSERTSSDYSAPTTSDLSPTAYACSRGHSHHSADRAARCDAKSRSSMSSVSSVSSVGSTATISSTFTAGLQAAPTRLEPLSEGNLSAFAASQSGGSEAHLRAPRSVATSTSTSTTQTWKNWGPMAAVLPVADSSRLPTHATPVPASARAHVPAPAPVPPVPSSAAVPAPPASLAQGYVPLIADYDPEHKDWYVVTVGRCVGVFRDA